MTIEKVMEIWGLGFKRNYQGYEICIEKKLRTHYTIHAYT